MRAIFIRHGESTGNAGVPCHDLATIELTERGQEQARAVAASWTEAPALIVTSPYTRTRQTAAPTIARFPGVPVEDVADRRVHLSATGALERHAQRRADAAPRTLLERGRS
jgi:broad specificity phosphatase PhoE